MALLDDLVEIAQHLPGQRLVVMGARDAQGAAVDADPHAQRLFDHMNVSVVLAEKIGEKPMVIEMELERIFSG
jgi:hypothetical protein